MKNNYKFAVLGTPIEHSLSPEIHRIFAEGCGIEIEYNKIDTDKPQLKNTVKRLQDEDYLGFNCTMPLKSEIVGLLDEKFGQVEFLNVCNTVKISDNKLHGYITDGDGMVQGIRYNGFDVENKNIMMLGAGDTSKAVLFALIKNRAKKIIILNRSKNNLDSTKAQFCGIEFPTETEKTYPNPNPTLKFELLNIENLIKNIDENDIDILINTTRLGMKGFEEHPDFSFIDRLKKNSIVVEAAYNPLYTQLLIKARDRGLAIIDGFWMLVYQGVLAFEIWTALKVPDEYIKKAHNIIKR